MRNKELANQFQHLNKTYKLYDDWHQQFLLMPDIIIAMNKDS